MKNHKLILILWLMLIIITSCTKDKLTTVENDTIAPGPVSNVQVKSLPGAAQLTYTLPGDLDLLYVKAEYTNKAGKAIEVKSSYYTNSLTIEGFSDTSNYVVNVYAVDRSENKSQVVKVNVKPLEPPYLSASEQIQIVKDFGGINIKTLNQTNASLAIVICSRDSLGNIVNDYTYYTNRDSINYSQRGYPSTLRTFAIYVRDRWNNCSDTIFTDLVPIFEKKLDKSKFKAMSLPTDAPVGWGFAESGMWDDIVAQDANMFHTLEVGFPMWFTFDLGVTAKLSRFTLWDRPGLYIFSHGNPKDYEIWGSNNPNPNGSWDGSWKKLLHCVSVKPSGLPLGQNSTEDIAAAAAGEQYLFPLTADPVRFIRFRVLKNWSGGTATHIAEVTFWGNDK